MAERSTLTQSSQWGVESTPGTAVAANRKLNALSIELGIKPEVKVFRPSGGKFPTISMPGKEWTEGDISGVMSYSDIVYALSGNVAYAAPVQQSATIAYLWTHTPSQSSTDTTKKYTIEQGSSVRAHRAPYGLVNSFGYSVNRTEATTKGAMLLQKLEDDITMTATPTEIEPVPMLPEQFCIYVDDASGDLGTTKLTREFAVDWEFNDRYGAVWPLDCALDGFAADVEMEPKAKLKLLVAADAQGMGFLDDMRAGTKKFIRIQATGSQIVSGQNYLFTHDVCAVVTSVEKFKDEQGVYAIQWEFTPTYDATWTKAFTIGVKNTLTGL